MNKDEIIFVTNKKAPGPHKNHSRRGTVIEVWECTFRNGQVEYISAFKCANHVGCKCGLEKVFLLINRSKLPEAKRIRQLKKPLKTIPLVTREKERTIRSESEALYNVDTLVYGPVDLDAERKYYNQLVKHGKKKMAKLLEKYGHLINSSFENVLHIKETENV
jgi:hypothetical protein